MNKCIHLRVSTSYFVAEYGHMIKRVLSDIWCDLDPMVNVKSQIMCFLVNASPKPFDVVTSNFTGA